MTQVDPTIVAIYGAAPEGLDLSQDPRAANDAVVGALLVVATLALALRLACRRTNDAAGFRSDDYSIVAALLFTYASGALAFAAARYGAGRHVWSLTPAAVSMAGQLTFINGFIFAAAVTLTKVSVLLLYARIFGLAQGRFRLNLWLTGAVTVAYPLTVVVGLLVSCQPVSYYWRSLGGYAGDGRCLVNTGLFYLVLAIVNLVINFWILVIPIPQILKLQMSARNKAAVCGLMLLGGFACVASIVRIYYLYVYAYGDDVAWYMGPVGLWSSAEPAIGIWAACLSVLRPLYRKFWHKVKPSRAHLRNNYINPSSVETVTFGTVRGPGGGGRPSPYAKYDDDAELASLGQRWLGSNVVADGAASEEKVEWKGIMVRTEVRLERVED